MSYVRARRIAWDPVDVPDLKHYLVYVAAADVPNFVAQAEARQMAPFAVVTQPEFILDGETGIAEGTWQFAVRAEDTNGNMSDVYQAEVWRSVPLDLTPPPAPTNGRIEFID